LFEKSNITDVKIFVFLDAGISARQKVRDGREQEGMLFGKSL
jgi:hypothetical protein